MLLDNFVLGSLLYPIIVESNYGILWVAFNSSCTPIPTTDVFNMEYFWEPLSSFPLVVLDPFLVVLNLLFITALERLVLRSLLFLFKSPTIEMLLADLWLWLTIKPELSFPPSWVVLRIIELSFFLRLLSSCLPLYVSIPLPVPSFDFKFFLGCLVSDYYWVWFNHGFIKVVLFSNWVLVVSRRFYVFMLVLLAYFFCRSFSSDFFLNFPYPMQC